MQNAGKIKGKAAKMRVGQAVAKQWKSSGQAVDKQWTSSGQAVDKRWPGGGRGGCILRFAEAESDVGICSFGLVLQHG